MLSARTLTDEMIHHVATLTGSPPSTRLSENIFYKDGDPMVRTATVRTALILASFNLGQYDSDDEATKEIDRIQRLLGTPDELPTVANMFEMLYAYQKVDGKYPEMELDKDRGNFRPRLKNFARFVDEIGGDKPYDPNKRGLAFFAGLYGNGEHARGMALSYEILVHARPLQLRNSAVSRLIQLIDDSYAATDR